MKITIPPYLPQIKPHEPGSWKHHLVGVKMERRTSAPYHHVLGRRLPQQECVHNMPAISQGRSCTGGNAQPMNLLSYTRL